MPYEDARHLRPRVLEACRIRAASRTDADAARRMGISYHTMKHYLYTARNLVGVFSTVELLIVLRKRGLLVG